MELIFKDFIATKGSNGYINAHLSYFVALSFVKSLPKYLMGQMVWNTTRAVLGFSGWWDLAVGMV